MIGSSKWDFPPRFDYRKLQAAENLFLQHPHQLVGSWVFIVLRTWFRVKLNEITQVGRLRSPGFFSTTWDDHSATSPVFFGKRWSHSNPTINLTFDESNPTNLMISQYFPLISHWIPTFNHQIQELPHGTSLSRHCGGDGGGGSGGGHRAGRSCGGRCGLRSPYPVNTSI